MNVLVVYAHPDPESFNASIFQLVCNGLQHSGHQVEILDLYQNGFEPAMSRAERLIYMDKNKNTAAIEDYVAQLQQADALILVYPTVTIY